MSLVSVKKMTVRISGVPVLSNVDFTIERGEIVTVVGPNGSGKSTLVKAIIGAVEPSSGSVSRPHDLKFGYVPQSLHLEPTLPMTIERFMALPVRHSKNEVRAALAQAGVPDLRRRQMSELSGGQFQRVLLARALLSKPDILILDEPTTGLDQPGSASFYRQIEEVRQSTGCAVLMVSHELHVVMAASDRVVCLNGHVCCHGTPEVVASAPEYRALFGSGTQGALALYRHAHDHDHDHDHDAEDCHDHAHHNHGDDQTVREGSRPV